MRKHLWHLPLYWRRKKVVSRPFFEPNLRTWEINFGVPKKCKKKRCAWKKWMKGSAVLHASLTPFLVAKLPCLHPNCLNADQMILRKGESASKLWGQFITWIIDDQGCILYIHTIHCIVWSGSFVFLSENPPNGEEHPRQLLLVRDGKSYVKPNIVPTPT